MPKISDMTSIEIDYAWCPKTTTFPIDDDSFINVMPYTSKSGITTWYKHNCRCSTWGAPQNKSSCNRGFLRYLKERRKSHSSPYQQKDLYYTFTISPAKGTMTGEQLLNKFLKKFITKKNCYSPYLNHFCIEHYDGLEGNPHIHCAIRMERQLQKEYLPTFMYSSKHSKKVAPATFQGNGMRLEFNSFKIHNKPHKKTGPNNHQSTYDYITKDQPSKKIYSFQGGKALLISEN